MNSEFSKYLISLRQSSKLSQSNLAKQVNCAASYVAAIELGERLPSDRIAQKIAEALNIDSTDIIKKLNKSRYIKQKSNHIKLIEVDQNNYLGEKTNEPFLTRILDSFIMNPIDFFAIERRIVTAAIITNSFWSDIESLERSEEFNKIMQSNLDKKVKYYYIYPKNEENILEKIKYLKAKHPLYDSSYCQFIPIKNDNQDLIFAGFEKVLYEDPEYPNIEGVKFNRGFFMDILGSKNPENLIIHQMIPEDQLIRYSLGIQKIIKI
ncbi:MAG: helix-turn-helix transcriptional regulator [Bacteriovoracia bacterium]